MFIGTNARSKSVSPFMGGKNIALLTELDNVSMKVLSVLRRDAAEVE